VDHVVAAEISEGARAQVVEGKIPDGMIGLDIGPKTAKMYEERIAKAKLVVWNGPMGYSEIKTFADGTRRIAQAMANSKAITIVGGGETAEAVEALGLQDKISHVSTGGGASLEFLGGKVLPGIAVLK